MNKWGVVLLMVANIIGLATSYGLFCEGGHVKEKLKKFGCYTVSVIFILIVLLLDYGVYLAYTNSPIIV